MFKRSHAALVALACLSGFAATAHAIGGNYSQAFASAPSGWSVPAQSWTVTNGEYRNSANNASPATIAYYNGNTWLTNYTYKVKAYSDWSGTGNQVGLVFGLGNASQYYAVLVNMSGRVTINQISGTTNTELTDNHDTPPVQVAADQFFDLQVFVNQHKNEYTGEDDGNEVTVSIDGHVAIAKFKMASVSGKLGLIARADMGHFDDVQVTDNLAARIFRGTFTGLEIPLQFALDQSSCSHTSDGRYSCWGDITGRDLSGDTWPFHLWGDDARVQFNSKAHDPQGRTNLTSSEAAALVSQYVGGSIANIDGRRLKNDGSGKYEKTDALLFELKQMDTEPPQMLYNLQPVDGVAQHDLYMRFWTKIPSNSQVTRWNSLFQMKTSSDYRLFFNFETSTNDDCQTSTPHWVISADGTANTTDTETYWKECLNDPANHPVPIDRWFKVEMFMHRSTTGPGRFWVAVDNQRIFDRPDADGLYAPVATHPTRQPIDRLLLPQLYGGNTYPKYQQIDDLEVWNGFPFDVTADH